MRRYLSARIERERHAAQSGHGPSVALSVKIGADDHDEIRREAERAGMSMGGYVRACLRLASLVRAVTVSDDDGFDAANEAMWLAANELWSGP